jgi:hypothetical protein
MILRFVRVLIFILLGAGIVTTAKLNVVAQGPCSQWDINGEWKIGQSNLSVVEATLELTPDGIQGSAKYLFQYRKMRYWRYGSVDGTINGSSIEFTIYWSLEEIGIYTGTITPQGRLLGGSYQKGRPRNRADWYSDRRATCLARGDAPGTSSTQSAPISQPEPGVKSGGRVISPARQQPSTLSKCEAAERARSRNSPAAPGLTAHCLAIVNDLAIKGQSMSQQDPTAAALRSRQPDALAQRGFDIGLAAVGGDTANGPGKQAIHNSLELAEQPGFTAAVSFSLERNRIQQTRNNAALAQKGEAIANRDPLTFLLRNLQPKGPTRRGFDIGMAAAERDTEPGPGKQRIHDSLLPAEQHGFTAAVTFLLARNKNAKLAAIGAAIARSDVGVDRARATETDPFYQLGFDIASGLFGDPAKGTQGSTQLGPGSLAIRSDLNAAGQRGFDAAQRLHFSRKYR